ncbi:MAG: hypothetical protein IKS90_03130 [Clostridia bacterium]|nr:hypothetical protein [Clostridia bacterium]
MKKKLTKALALMLASVMLIAAICSVACSTDPKPDPEKPSVNIGDTYVFGAYEQDNDTSNGKEEIEWIVLDKQGSSLLLISKYALDCKPYNEAYAVVTWETCTLRGWLNNEFINEAFGSDEKAMIQTTQVKNDDNAEYGTAGGNDTDDKVFLISIDEAERYFSSDAARECEATDYAVNNGVVPSAVYTAGGNPTCWWWLRSPGADSHCAVHVECVCGVKLSGCHVYNDTHAVRPALWVNPGS